MIVGCYTLDLYCKNTLTGGAKEHTCARSPYEANEPGQWTGRTYTICRAAARKDGWRFDPNDADVTCPWCTRAAKPGKLKPVENTP